MTPPSLPTQIVQAEIGTDTAFNAVTPPLYLTTTYNFEGFEKIGPYDYGRSGNPNRDGLGRVLAKLEHGAHGIMTASGMAAIDLVTNLLSRDDIIIAPHDCYGGTHRLFTHRARQGRFKVIFVDQTDPDALSEALSHNPKLVFVETPSNPLMRLVDIEAICNAAQAVGAQTVVDNTFLSPARQLPLTLGADFVVHSTTKYLNGHSDVVGGCLITRTPEDGETLAWWANCTGVTGAPFDSYLTLRGLRTLSVRMDAQETNAIKIAEFLAAHDRVAHIYYPGLTTDPGYGLMQRQQKGPGAMLSFELHGGVRAVKTVLENTQIFQLAESLGGVESLICHPATMTHRGMEAEARAKAGVKENLIRLSVGIEHIDDLTTDLRHVFSKL